MLRGEGCEGTKTGDPEISATKCANLDHMSASGEYKIEIASTLYVRYEIRLHVIYW